jgi:hypothetical protein
LDVRSRKWVPLTVKGGDLKRGFLATREIPHVVKFDGFKYQKHLKDLKAPGWLVDTFRRNDTTVFDQMIRQPVLETGSKKKRARE